MSTRSTPPPSRPAVPDVAEVRTLLEQLRLPHAAGALADLLSQSVSGQEGPLTFLNKVLTEECTKREESRIRTSLRLSGLPTQQTLASFDFAFQPAIERQRIETLATGSWIREQHNLLLLGPPGVGKTHLAVGLGIAAIERGLSVSYYRIEDLLHVLRQDAHTPPAHLRRKKYMNVALLIIDEVGFESFTREEANLLFRLVSHRYQRGSICITSNKPVSEWPDMLAGDETLATALLDRLLHSTHVLNISGRSYRLRDLDQALRATQKKSA